MVASSCEPEVDDLELVDVVASAAEDQSEEVPVLGLGQLVVLGRDAPEKVLSVNNALEKFSLARM